MDMKKNFINSFLCLLFLFYGIAFTPGSDGLKSIRLDAPKYIREGEEVRLSCQYDIDTRSLYAVKWYHGIEEFYRYLPKESPPQQVFSKKGITVNVTSSNDHQVVLTNTTRDTSGKFKCVVSAEITFKTLEDVQEISVVAIGYDSPKLFMDQVGYSQGDTARANCSIDKTSPSVNISWFINDVEVPNLKSKTSQLPDMTNPLLISTISTLTFQLPETASLVRLKCTGQLFDVYSMSSEMKISLKPRRLSMMSTSPDTLTTRLNDTTKDSAQGVHQPNWHSPLLFAQFNFIYQILTLGTYL